MLNKKMAGGGTEGASWNDFNACAYMLATACPNGKL